MKAYLYLNEVRHENLIATVENLEVIPRGIYQVDNKEYYYSGTPRFVIKSGDYRGEYHKLIRVDIIVEEYTGQDANVARRQPT